MSEKIEQAMMKYVKLFLGEGEEINLQGFGSGQIFSRMLMHAQGFRFGFGDYIESPSNWIQKLSNVKVIVRKITQYFESKLGKGIKTNDINLIQIAKNNKKNQILKLFQIVLATLTQSPNKQQHINKIMSLDENAQSNFVCLIQKILQNRMIEFENYRRDKQIYMLQELEFENSLLQKEIDSILQQKKMLEEELNDLKVNAESKEIEMAEIMEKIGVDTNDKNYVLSVHNEQLKNMVENLKNKLLENTHKHQIQVYKLNQQVAILNNRIRKLEQAEETLQLYKQKYNEVHILAKDNKRWEKEIIRLNRQMTQKQNYIKKIQQKLDESIEKNYQHEEKEVYLMMELEKKEVQFRELEKEVKKKISSADNSQNFTISDTTHSHAILSEDLTLGQSFISDELLENRELKQTIEKLKKKNREAQREKNRLQRKLEKVENLQLDKRKLQRMVIDAHEARTQQLLLLLSVLDHLHSQNFELQQKIKIPE